MKQILACTDGSQYATSVYDHAAWVAGRTGASVHLLHMLDPLHERANSADWSGNLTTDTSDELLQEFVRLEEARSKLARERGKRLLTAATDYLSSRIQTPVTTEQQHGELVEAVSRMETKFDLLILGKRGESADFAKMHLGSSLERVLRASHRPVLVASREFRPIERILIAYDGGPSIEKAMAFAVSEPLLQGLECHLVRAGKIDEKAEWFLHEAADKIRASGFSVTPHLIPGHPEEAISGLVTSKEIDLLVMGAYGHGRMRNLILGSTTTTLVRTCLIPVLLFR
jgi:nucleotide-binding universal stress UspA family protein